MPGKAAEVKFTERQQEVLEAMTKASTTPKHLSQRARIILLAFSGLDNETIALEVGLGRRHVGKWRRRWKASYAALVAIECNESAAGRRGRRDGGSISILPPCLTIRGSRPILSP